MDLRDIALIIGGLSTPATFVGVILWRIYIKLTMLERIELQVKSFNIQVTQLALQTARLEGAVFGANALKEKI